jgi:catalase-peroxidase
MDSQKTEAKCPFHQATGAGTTNRDWWPKQLRVDLLHQHSSKSDPMGEAASTTPRNSRASIWPR